jgi:hypothetical protein
MVTIFVKIFHSKIRPAGMTAEGLSTVVTRYTNHDQSKAKLRFRRRQFRFQRSHFLQKLVGALGFGRIHAADGEAHMDHHIVAHASLGNKVQGYLAHDPAELHAGRTQRPQFLNFENLPWYGKAHGSSPHSQYIRAVTPICVTRSSVTMRPGVGARRSTVLGNKKAVGRLRASLLG